MNIICPNCNNKCFICLDEWGPTPFHIHCNVCKINIGTTDIKKGIELLKKYHKPNTYLEYYNQNIQFLLEEEKIIIDYE